MFPGISRTFLVQISYPGTSLERREPELSFDTNIDGVSGCIVADTATFLKCTDLFNRACTCFYTLYKLSSSQDLIVGLVGLIFTIQGLWDKGFSNKTCQ